MRNFLYHYHRTNIYREFLQFYTECFEILYKKINYPYIFFTDLYSYHEHTYSHKETINIVLLQIMFRTPKNYIEICDYLDKEYMTEIVKNWEQYGLDAFKLGIKGKLKRIKLRKKFEENYNS